jgi:hypothetical protein
MKPKMSVEQKPHPYSIEAILGLRDSGRQNLQSFRPYLKPKNEYIGISEPFSAASLTRMVPRAGHFPLSSVVLAETQQRFIRCGLHTRPDNGVDNMDTYSFRTAIMRKEVSDQGI